jgi:hypothetical protein
MPTFRVHVAFVGSRRNPVKVLCELMRELPGAGGIVGGDCPTGFRYLFSNDDYETCSDFRSRLEQVIENKVQPPVKLTIERMDRATGLWVTD